MRPADDAELAEVLSAGSDAIGFPLAAGQVECFVAYIRLIEKWNATYNLTAIRDPRAMATHHILDCLAAAAALIARRGRRAEHLLDVGSGAGLPGIVIAIVAPERQILCVDSVGKKAAFITQVAGALGLKNLAVRHARVESLHAQRFDVIACRAFASLHVFVRETRRLLSEEGIWMAMKGKVPDTDLAWLINLTFHVEPLEVPGLTGDRCVVWLSQEASASLP